ncbi:hypothetical protein K439DRAFT_1346663 [Ramaria rubella]|nr:hypothetical protein K439DRAFT_1346663 [Ramaria rubella]
MTSENKPKVICLGLGRTGTTSLMHALEMLGFGPCYHFKTISLEGGTDMPTWIKIGNGEGTLDDFHSLLDRFGAVLDYPAAMYTAELYTAYPDAKFILTTRDPAAWEKSMRSTIMRHFETLRKSTDKSPLETGIDNWSDIYHGGRLATHPQQELLDHNERVKQIIPPEQLLVFEVGEGWDRLVQFLGVSKPTVPWPHLNDTAQFVASAIDKTRSIE